MALLQALDQSAEINSVAINSLVNAFGPFKNNALKLLATQGITDLTPGKWYSQQSFLDAFKNLPGRVGDLTINRIGINYARNLKFPSDIDTVEKALMLMDVSYQEYYRNGEIGSYKFRKTGERECTLLCSSPYPCAFDQGVLKEVCNRLKPDDSKEIIIEHSTDTGCRKTGSFACTYIISW